MCENVHMKISFTVVSISTAFVSLLIRMYTIYIKSFFLSVCVCITIIKCVRYLFKFNKNHFGLCFSLICFIFSLSFPLEKKRVDFKNGNMSSYHSLRLFFKISSRIIDQYFAMIDTHLEFIFSTSFLLLLLLLLN